MDNTWSLDDLYTSFESDQFKSDMDACLKGIEAIKVWTAGSLGNYDDVQGKIVQYINMLNNFSTTFSRLISYAQLVQSTDAKNEKALQSEEQLLEKITGLTGPQVIFQKWLAGVDSLDNIFDGNATIREHEFMLRELVAKNRYLLSDKEEILFSKMRNTGSNAWSRLQELISSTLLVDITADGEETQLPLSMVRNMAYETDAKVRKNAYEAELKSYRKIEDSSAASLNAIKGEVITAAGMRGYDSPLDKTLQDSRMDRETLDAMLTAMRESLPGFHGYYRKKAELMGYKNGLPFYDLFAPMGEVNMRYTYEQAREFIVRNFRTFSDSLADYADYAFENRWIDAPPRDGKRGGAFCSNLHSIKQSRILTNFTGSFSDVITLAHELGHGYHGQCLNDETYLNSDYPMPIAETASTFCETIIKNAALKNCTDDEAFAILESDISDSGQVIVDIYCRYLFETELFERRKEGSMSARELKDAMLRAQKEAYGDGLDHELLHPYMWVCKSHYYSADYNFYNFPYAFGLLFAKGLYAEYLKRGPSFVAEYDKLLSVTGKKNLVDVAGIMGIDLHSVDYWRSSLKLIEADIDRFVAMKR